MSIRIQSIDIDNAHLVTPTHTSFKRYSIKLYSHRRWTCM